MKIIFLLIIVVLSFLAIYRGLPTMPFLSLIGLLAAAPLGLIIIKKNLVNALMLWFLFALFAFKGYGDIPLALLPDISLARILWISMFLIFFVEVCLKQRKIIPITKVEIAMILLCVYISGSMILAGTGYKEGHGLFLRIFLNTYLLPFSIFFLSKNIINDEREIKKVFIFFAILGFYLGFTGICEYFKLNFLVFPKYIMNPSKGIALGLARGPFVSPAANGQALGMLLFIPIYLFYQVKNKLGKFSLSITIIFMLTALFFTYNRASWFGLLLSLILITVFVRKIQMKKVFIASLLVVMLIYTFSQIGLLGKQPAGKKVTSMNPVYDRIYLQQAAWKMFFERPIFGFGYDAFKEYSYKYFSPIKGIPYGGWEEKIALHDTLGAIVSELGLVGLSLNFFIIFYILRIGRKLYRQLPEGEFLGKGLVATFLGMLIVFLVTIEFSGMRNSLFPLSLFFLVSGIIVRLYQRTSLVENVPVEK